MKLEFEVEIDGLGDALRVATLTVTAIALYRELSKPPLERTWHGEVVGVVPYDFRAPTLERVRYSYWNPHNPSLFLPAAFGIGWALNVPVLAGNLGRLVQDAMGEARARLASRERDKRTGVSGTASSRQETPSR